MTISAGQDHKAWWVVVADESSAILYSRASRRGDLVKVEVLENEAGRKKVGDLISDRGGRSFDSTGRGRHTMAREKVGPKTHAAERFAKKVAARIADIHLRGKCRGYVLVAPPRFLGMLREAAGAECKLEPCGTIDKELVGLPVDELRRYVDKVQ